MGKKRWRTALGGLLLAALLLGCGEKEPCRRTEFLLDTVVTVTLYDGTEADLAAAFEEMERLEGLLSAYAPGSDLVALAREAGRAEVPLALETMELLQFAQEMYAATAKKLDVSAGPLIDLWAVDQGGHYPSAQELAAALGLLGLEELTLDPAAGTGYLPRAGMSLNLGALAKGYIADRVKELLQSRGVTSGVIDLGHNLLLLGEKPGGKAFSLGIQNPAGGELLRILALRDKSLVTSGTYERYFEYEGRRYHHVLDPSTGYPADTGLWAVTILSQSSLLGDALSTACLLLGPEEGRALVDGIEEAEALFVLEDGRILTTAGFPEA